MAGLSSFHFTGELTAVYGAAGISVGDFFSGHFAFDPAEAATSTSPSNAKYALASFIAEVPHARLAPTNPEITVSVDPQDPSIAVYGEAPFGLYMGVLFRGGTSVTDTHLPSQIKLTNFVIKHFTICDVGAALFGYDQTVLKPPDSKVFVRGEVTHVSRAHGLWILRSSKA